MVRNGRAPIAEILYRYCDILSCCLDQGWRDGMQNQMPWSAPITLSTQNRSFEKKSRKQKRMELKLYSILLIRIMMSLDLYVSLILQWRFQSFRIQASLTFKMWRIIFVIQRKAMLSVGILLQTLEFVVLLLIQHKGKNQGRKRTGCTGQHQRSILEVNGGCHISSWTRMKVLVWMITLWLSLVHGPHFWEAFDPRFFDYTNHPQHFSWSDWIWGSDIFFAEPEWSSTLL